MSLPVRHEVQALVRIHPVSDRFAHSFVPGPGYGWYARFYQAEPAPVVGTTKCPESLCPMLALPSSGSRVADSSEDITPRSLLLRTHSPILCGSPQLRLLASYEGSVQVATSPCCRQDLPDVISANLSWDAWAHTPAVPLSAFAWFFLSVIGLPQRVIGSASRLFPRTRFSAGEFRGCSYFVMFRPHSLLASQIVPTAASLLAGQLRRLRPSRTCVVTFARIGYAIRLTTGN